MCPMLLRLVSQRRMILRKYTSVIRLHSRAETVVHDLLTLKQRNIQRADAHKQRNIQRADAH